ncbi:MAG: restriction endonuclease, partial [bacterium]
QEDAGQTLGRSGDGGIDGKIKEDRLGLDFICVQAKRWESNVGRPIVQAFAGSLDGFRARKGVLITTSGFTKEAIEYVKMIGKSIVLIDGEELTRLMFEYDLGVTPVKHYVLKKLDHDYFEES